MNPVHTRRRSRLGAPLLFLLVLAAAPAALAAQQTITVPGQVLGPDNAPIAGLRVVLHRVDASGGATIAEVASAADGGFELVTEASPDTAAVYFVAARYEEELYIGQPFRPGAAVTPPQILQVGVAATSASALLQDAEGGPPMGRPATSTSWLLLLVPLLGLAGVIFYFLMPRRRIAPDRAAYIRIAEIDERLDAAPEGQRASLHDERARLVDQLRAG